MANHTIAHQPPSRPRCPSAPVAVVCSTRPQTFLFDVPCTRACACSPHPVPVRSRRRPMSTSSNVRHTKSRSSMTMKAWLPQRKLLPSYKRLWRCLATDMPRFALLLLLRHRFCSSHHPHCLPMCGWSCGRWQEGDASEEGARCRLNMPSICISCSGSSPPSSGIKFLFLFSLAQHVCWSVFLLRFPPCATACAHPCAYSVCAYSHSVSPRRSTGWLPSNSLSCCANG
jgi:hypothetical protein